MGLIQQLDQSTIIKLAAGEIIDRPVSIVKELIENSIDSGASQIYISTQQGGISEIIVTDNGKGISHDDIELTIQPHATSKLSHIDDLQTVHTMGFRGEALSSIAEVADISILSSSSVDDIGIELQKKSGESDVSILKKARQKGTTITVSHLFKKIPVRFRFLKSPASECSAISKSIQQFIFHYPHIAFEFSNNNNTILSSVKNGDLLAQFKHSLKLNADEVLTFSKTTHDIQVSGVITAPIKTFKKRQKCWFSVNNRLVQAPFFFKAIQQALVDVIPKQMYPAIVCNIDCSTEEVDINIHPKKEEIKFVQNDIVFLAIKRAVQSAVLQHTSSWKDSFFTVSDQKPTISADNVDSTINLPKNINDSTLSFKKSDQKPSVFSCNSDLNQAQKNLSQVLNEQLPIMTNQRTETSKINVKKSEDSLFNLPKSYVDSSAKLNNKWLSFKNKYIIVPLDSDLLVFDQHAVHERILYDQLKNDSNKGALVSMPLLVPEYIQLRGTVFDQVKEILPLIRACGVDMDIFDKETFIIREIPHFFSTVTISEWIKEWISDDTVSELDKKPSDFIKEALQMKACKAAVKAGQKLHDVEVKALIEQCMNSDQQFTCPHGRPLYIKIKESSLDNMFLR